MVTRPSHFRFDWWVVQKRAVQLTSAALVVCLLASCAALYVWTFGNPLRRVALKTDAAAGARIESFEGGGRVIHAATREVVLASRDTPLYPGDMVQTQADGRARIAMADG